MVVIASPRRNFNGSFPLKETMLVVMPARKVTSVRRALEKLMMFTPFICSWIIELCLTSISLLSRPRLQVGIFFILKNCIIMISYALYYVK